MKKITDSPISNTSLTGGSDKHHTSIYAFLTIMAVTMTGCPGPRVDCMDAGCMTTESGGSETADTGTDSVGDGDPGDGDGDGDDGCESLAEVVCDGPQCWAQAPEWPAWAAWSDPDSIQDRLDAGLIVPSDIVPGTDCYEIVGTDAHECVVVAECTALVGRPLAEVDISPSNCAPVGGPWSEVGIVGVDTCVGIVGDFAVQLEVDVGQPFLPGSAWGPCPTLSGIPTLCDSEAIACVPADFGEANICLPLEACPFPEPDIGTSLELGWGMACYPRCNTDDDCLAGMVCGVSLADNTDMCAWPRA
jgi:hypothetical protein